MKKQAVRTRDLFYIGLIALLLFIKGRLFYPPLLLAGYETAFALLTAFVPVFVWAVLSFFSPKTGRIAAAVLYVFLSFLMAVDAVYWSYASKLTSAAQITMAHQLTEVSDSVLNLIKVPHVLMIADLPVRVLLWVHGDLVRSRLGRTGWGNRFLAFLEKECGRFPSAAAGVLCSLAAFGSAFLWPGFRPEYIENELCAYHAEDLARTLFSRESERPVDKSRYASPDWSSSPYWGIAADRNIVVIQVEALQNFVIGREYRGQEIMPTLNGLIGKDTIYFDRYYYQIGGANTADAEFAVNNSLFAPESNGAYVQYPTNRYYSLPFLLKDHGWKAAEAFHGYVASFWNREFAYPYQGFDDYTSLEDLDQTDMFPLGLSDKEFYRQTAEILADLPEPFYAFCITASSHYPYGIPLKDREIELDPSDEQTLFGLYLQAVNYADRAIGEFLEELKEAGLYDNSIFLIYGDHYALPNTNPDISRQVGDLTGGSYTIFDVFNVPFLIHIPGAGVTETISTAGGHMDVMPTLLCLLGIRNDRAVMFGQNLLAAETGFVCEQTHVSVGSFISDEVFFQKPHNNIRSNYRVYERGTMELKDPDEYGALSAEARDRILDCAALLARDDVFLDP